MCGGGSKVQWGEALVVRLADVGTIVNQFADHGILTIKTGYMERCVPKCIGLINLQSDRENNHVIVEEKCLSALCLVKNEGMKVYAYTCVNCYFAYMHVCHCTYSICGIVLA